MWILVITNHCSSFLISASSHSAPWPPPPTFSGFHCPAHPYFSSFCVSFFVHVVNVLVIQLCYTDLAESLSWFRPTVPIPRQLNVTKKGHHCKSQEGSDAVQWSIHSLTLQDSFIPSLLVSNPDTPSLVVAHSWCSCFLVGQEDWSNQRTLNALHPTSTHHLPIFITFASSSSQPPVSP